MLLSTHGRQKPVRVVSANQDFPNAEIHASRKTKHSCLRCRRCTWLALLFKGESSTGADGSSAEQLASAFHAAEISCRTLVGTTPTQQRLQLLQDFRDGRFQVLVNCAILTEGADVPAIDCVRKRQCLKTGLGLTSCTGSYGEADDVEEPLLADDRSGTSPFTRDQ